MSWWLWGLSELLVVDIVAVVNIASGTVDNLQDVKTKIKPTIGMNNFVKFLYRVFHVIGNQEQGCCGHVFELIGLLKASMGP